MLAPLRPDLIVSASFPWVIPDDVIALPRVAAVNMHGGLLPQRRGPNAIGWAFRDADRETGFTIHRLDSGLDTGPILARASVPIDDDDDLETLFSRLLPLVPQVWAAALARIAAGDPGDAQDEALAHYAGAFEESYRTIDWTQPARAIHNQVRAWNAGQRGVAPGAVGEIDGVPARILRTRLIAADGAGSAAPGTVLSRDDAGAVIQCGDAPLALLRFEAIDVS
jgi:methionyl-tRNA formyltransferase